MSLPCAQRSVPSKAQSGLSLVRRPAQGQAELWAGQVLPVHDAHAAAGRPGQQPAVPDHGRPGGPGVQRRSALLGAVQMLSTPHIAFCDTACAGMGLPWPSVGGAASMLAAPLCALARHCVFLRKGSACWHALQHRHAAAGCSQELAYHRLHLPDGGSCVPARARSLATARCG